MTIYTDQKHQEKVEEAANMIYQPKQRDKLNKENDEMAISAVVEVSHVSSYPLL